MTLHLQINYPKEKHLNFFLKKIDIFSFRRRLYFYKLLRHPKRRWENYCFDVSARRKSTENAVRCCSITNDSAFVVNFSIWMKIRRGKGEKLGAATLCLSRVTRNAKSTQRSILSEFLKLNCIINASTNNRIWSISHSISYKPKAKHSQCAFVIEAIIIIGVWGQILFSACGAPTELRRWQKNIIFHLIERDGFLFTLQLRDFVITFQPSCSREGQLSTAWTLVVITKSASERFFPLHRWWTLRVTYFHQKTFANGFESDELLIIWQHRDDVIA